MPTTGVYKSDITTCYENLECAISAKEHWKLNTTYIGCGTFKSENKFLKNYLTFSWTGVT